LARVVPAKHKGQLLLNRERFAPSVLRFATAGVTMIAAFCGRGVFRDSSFEQEVSHEVLLIEDPRGLSSI